MNIVIELLTAEDARRLNIAANIKYKERELVAVIMHKIRESANAGGTYIYIDCASRNSIGPDPAIVTRILESIGYTVWASDDDVNQLKIEWE